MIIANATITNEGRTFVGWVRTCGQVIAEVHEGTLSARQIRDLSAIDADITDATGLLMIPGVIDEHVHFRDPGMTEAADLQTESRAAIAGGITSYMDMPNTRPATTTIRAWQDKMEHAAQVSAANYAFYLGATGDNMDEIMRADPAKVPCLKVFMGQSTGNMKVDTNLLDKIFAQSPLMIAVHAEDTDLIAQNQQAMKERFGDDIPMELHPQIRSEEACLRATRLAISLARKHRRRLHIMHISTASELELLDPAPLGRKLITAETCPHYLSFCGTDYRRLGGRIKCNPAIKTATDRSALIAALADGRIDTIGTDHAPHPLTAKQACYAKCPSGMPSVQFALPAMLRLASQGAVSMERVVDLMCHNPATVYGIERRGFIRPGYQADLVLIRREDWTATDRDVVSKCRWTPYIGTTFSHKTERTVINGQTAYHDGKIYPTHGQPLKFSR